jgi:ubiquitin-protein ligase
MAKTETATFKLGEYLTRTLEVSIYDWGVGVVSKDKNPYSNAQFEARRFKLTKNYPTIESNIKRGMSYFKADVNTIENVCKNLKIGD